MLVRASAVFFVLVVIPTLFPTLRVGAFDFLPLRLVLSFLSLAPPDAGVGVGMLWCGGIPLIERIPYKTEIQMLEFL